MKHARPRSLVPCSQAFFSLVPLCLAALAGPLLLTGCGGGGGNGNSGGGTTGTTGGVTPTLLPAEAG